jgi:hypothetical protein
VSRVGDFGHRAGRPVELPEAVEGAGGVRLLLRDASPPRSRRPFWADYQLYRAVLHVPGRLPRRMAVEVELAPWSTGRTEVGLRFARQLRPEGNRRYFDAAARAVDALVQQLEKRAAAPPFDAAVGQVARAVTVSPT